MDEVANILVSVDLVLVVGNCGIFRLVFIDPCLPDLIIPLDLILKFFEEHGVFISEFVF
jgi:hypothetical protein